MVPIFVFINYNFRLVSTIWFHWYQRLFCWLEKFQKIVLKSGFKMYWYELLTCKESLISPPYIDSCWVYLTLRSLTSLLYVIHVCRGSFTSPLIYCILCFMWLGSSHLFSYKYMYAGGVNFTSLLFIYVYRIYISLLLVFPLPLCWWIDKKGEKNLVSLYMHVYFISSFMQKRGKEFVIYASIFVFGLCISLKSLCLFLCMS